MVTAHAIGDTFATWLATAPPACAWPDLPFRIGLVARRDGAWDDFIRLAPNRDLPAFVAEAIAPARRAVLDLPRLTAAHHYAAMAGIVTDRIVDGQCRLPGLREIRRDLAARWLAALSAGLRDPAAARAAAAEAAAQWRRGLALERGLVAGAIDGWDAYVRSVALRLRWVSATATAMLVAGGAAAAAIALRATYDRFLLALQVMDDHDDRAEDERTRGASFRPLRELSEGPRPMAALLMAGAAERARGGGLVTLGDWLHDFAQLLLVAPGRPRAAA